MHCIKGVKHGLCSWVAAGAALGLWSGAIQAAEQATVVPASRKAEAQNMRLVGYSDLQGRSAYQPLVHHQGGRWIAYIGHHGGTRENPKP